MNDMHRLGFGARLLGGAALLAASSAAQDSRPEAASRPATTTRPATEDVVAFLRKGRVYTVGTTQGAVERMASDFDLQYDRPLAWDADGKRLFCWLNPAGWDVGAIELASGAVVDLTRTHDDCRMARPSPDGSRIAFQRGGVGVCVMNADGSKARVVAPRGHRDAAPAWSPDGTRLAFMDLESLDVGRVATSVWVAPVDGGEPRRIVEHADEPWWSADGAVVFALAARAPDGADLYSVPVDGAGPPKRLTFDGGAKSGLAFTADRARCAWLRTSGDGTPRLCVLDLRGGSTPKEVAELTGRPHPPSWAPDGGRLAYTSGDDGSRSLWIMDVPAWNSIRVADDVAWPVWRP
ncbi:MAG TPA: hypothetical protein VEI02_06295 [Planctomycetota bacterium]|nr:hypothetical protein [Planctomycetota bacterium]